MMVQNHFFIFLIILNEGKTHLHRLDIRLLYILCYFPDVALKKDILQDDNFSIPAHMMNKI